MTTNAFSVGASTTTEAKSTAKGTRALVLSSMDLSMGATNFSKLFEGDLYEDELNELPDLFSSGTNLPIDNGTSFFSRAAATAVVDAAFNQAAGFALETSKSPEPTTTRAQGHRSPTTDKSQMEMEFNDWASSGKGNSAPTSSMQPSPKLLLRQTPQLFGRRISLPKEPAPIPLAARRASLGSQSDAKSHQGANVPSSVAAPVAPRVSNPTVVLAPSPFKRSAPPVLAPLAPVPTPEVAVVAIPPEVKVAQPIEPMFLPPPTTTPSKPTPTLETPSAKVETIAKATVTKVLKTKIKQRRYKRKDPCMTEEEAEIEALKETLNSLVDQRDADQRKANVEEQKKLQNRQVRFQVMQTFLRLRGGKKGSSNTRDQALWTSILDETITLCRPTCGGSSQVEAVVSGVSSVMSDPSEAGIILKSMAGSRIRSKRDASVAFTYECDRSTLLMDGCTCILQWKGTTEGVTVLGFPSEIALSGTLRACFNEKTNKLVAAALFYDTGSCKSHVNKNC